MTHRNVETLIGRLATDPAFRRRFAADPVTVLDEMRAQGCELTGIELEALASIRSDALDSFADALDRRIRKADVGSAADPQRVTEGDKKMQTTTDSERAIAAAHPAVVHEERMVRANGIDVRAQSFGNPKDPALLLIGGATASMKRWPEEFCTRLAGAGRFVIRYDNRDAGRSTTFPIGAPGYSIRDMADDAVGVLDAYGVQRAHIAGWSMGGMIAQNVAIHHPDRVRSLFLFGSTPDGSAIGSAATGAGKNSGRLSSPAAPMVELFGFLASVDWTDEEQAIDAWVHEDQVLLGPGDTPAPELDRVNVMALVREARSIQAQRNNHGVAVATSYWRDRLKDIRTPTLVVHGTHDYCLPLDHAEAMAREIPGAKLIVVEGMGHVLSPTSNYWQVFAETLVAHTAN